MWRRTVVASVAALLIAGCGEGSPSQDTRDRAVNAALAAYHQAKIDGTNLNRGPCIAEQLPGMSDWVADVAHDPRQPVDDVRANQCRRYRDGQAHHFVELDISGHLIRAQ
jgi:hypothetical protein